jgi:hypothetical protein
LGDVPNIHSFSHSIIQSFNHPLNCHPEPVEGHSIIQSSNPSLIPSTVILSLSKDPHPPLPSPLNCHPELVEGHSIIQSSPSTVTLSLSKGIPSIPHPFPKQNLLKTVKLKAENYILEVKKSTKMGY